MRLQKKTGKVVKTEAFEKEFSSGGIVVRNEGDFFVVLLIKDRFGHWSWPKGHIDKGESTVNAAIREIREETGLKKVTLVKKIGKTQYYHRLKGKLMFKTVFLYLFKTHQATFKIQKDEIDDARWFAPAEAIGKVKYKDAKMLLRKVLTSFSALLLLLFAVSNSWADSLFLKDQRELKGIVVEDYADRIIFSTVEGEETILKSDVIHIEYSEREDNLIALGDAAFSKSQLKVALKYYIMAQNINPGMPALDDKIFHIEAILNNAPEMRKREHLAIKNEIMSGQAFPTPNEIEPAEDLKRRLGIEIRTRAGRFYIKKMSDDSPFKRSGAGNGDVIAAVWSRLCDYLGFADFYKLLTDERESFLMIVIERDVSIQKDIPFDAGLTMEWDGIIVQDLPEGGPCEKAGLKIQDNIIAIDGNLLRYTPLRSVLRQLRDMSTEKMLTVRRKLNIMR